MNPAFDQFSESYDRALADALAVTGEDKNYYLRGRLRCIQHRLSEFVHPVVNMLDYGCSIGANTPFLLADLHPATLLGVDPSPQSIDRANREFASERVRFSLLDEYNPAGSMDLVYSNGVFHHIPPQERPQALTYVRDSLRPGGIFAFAENNPWNPGTKYVMSRCAFDVDAIPITPRQCVAMLRSAGFQVLRQDFLFFFPRWLAALRGLEDWLRPVPLGGQYITLARKPGSL